MVNKKIVVFLVSGILLVLLGFSLGKSSQPAIDTSPDSDVERPNSSVNTPVQITSDNKSKVKSKVTKVIDGDTMQVDTGGKIETLRLIGIDTPELVDPRKPVQCFAKEASNKAKETLTGKNVFLEADPTQGERDKYNRFLRYIFLEDGTNFNKLMISEGYAHEYTYQSNPYKYQLEFKQAELEAREQKRGLWADNACSVSPTVYQSAAQPTSQLLITTSGNYVCDCNKFCSQISSCDEAYFQLNQCGCSKRDADGDGMPCESLCR